MEDVINTLRVRAKRTVLRKLEAGEVIFDKAKKIFVYKDTEEEYKVEHKGDDDEDSGSDDESDGDHEDSDDS